MPIWAALVMLTAPRPKLKAPIPSLAPITALVELRTPPSVMIVIAPAPAPPRIWARIGFPPPPAAVTSLLVWTTRSAAVPVVCRSIPPPAPLTLPAKAVETVPTL